MDGRAVSFINSRLRRLEERRRSGRCPECDLPPDGPGRIVVTGEGYAQEGYHGTHKRCGRCARPLWCVLRVVYEDAEGSDAA